MAKKRKPNKRSQNSDQKAKLEEQVPAKSQLRQVESPQPAGTRDIDKLMTWIAVALGACAGIAYSNDFTIMGHGLSLLTVWCAFAAIIAHMHEERGLPGPLQRNPLKTCAVALFVIFSGALALARYFEHPTQDLLGPATPQLMSLAPEERIGVLWETENWSPAPLQLKGISVGVDVRNKGEDNFDCEVQKATKLAISTGPAMNMPRRKPLGTMVPGDRPEDVVMLSALDADLIAKGEKLLYSWYGAVYTDSSGNPRVSTHCAYYDVVRRTFVSDMKYFRLGEATTWEELAVPERANLQATRHAMTQYEVGQPIEITIDFRNNGMSKASEVSSVGEFVPARNVAEVDDFISHVFTMWRTEGVPKDKKELSFFDTMRVTNGRVEHLDQGLADAIANGEAIILVVARIEYVDDKFGKHWLNFCAQFDGTTFVPREEYCEADGGAVPFVFDAGPMCWPQ